MDKPKLTNSQLISHLKEKGVVFTSMTETAAEEFITDSTYFYKLASYKKNFVKDNDGKYVDLEFEALVELSRLDKKLRHILFPLCIDVEHVIKTRIVQEVCDCSDGYIPIQEYFAINPSALDKIQNQDRPSSYSHNVFFRYNPDFPIWVFVELVSFGTITSFCNFINDRYGCRIENSTLLNNMRDLRNAIAHNFCLINNIVSLNDVSPSGKLYSFVSTYGIGRDARRTLTNRFVNDLITLLYLHRKFVDDSTKFEDLKKFLAVDVLTKSHLFSKNTNIKRVYNFLKTVIDKF